MENLQTIFTIVATLMCLWLSTRWNNKGWANSTVKFLLLIIALTGIVILTKKYLL